MRPLTSTLTREQLAERLDLSLELVDALLDSGRVLCHVTRGEVRVPLAQVEEFLRETLIRVYQAEGGGEAASVQSSPASVSAEPAPPPEPVIHISQPAPEPEPEPAPVTAPVHPAPPPQAVVEHERPDQRIASRYVPLRQLSGIFGDVKFSVLQLSATGLRIRHADPLMPGDEAKLSFALMKPARSVVVRARVVWTSIARSGDEHFSISGLRLIEHADRLEQAIASLKAAHELQPERRTRMRREGDGLTMIGGISDEEMALVTGAVRKFADDPVEASRWYSRARFALSDETVRRLAPDRPREREEVLGVWEYLERRVDIAKIAGVMSWMRAN
jgi:hypothetical protein